MAAARTRWTSVLSRARRLAFADTTARRVYDFAECRARWCAALQRKLRRPSCAEGQKGSWAAQPRDTRGLPARQHDGARRCRDNRARDHGALWTPNATSREGLCQAHRAPTFGRQHATTTLSGIRTRYERLWEWGAWKSGNGNARRMTNPLKALAGAPGIEPGNGGIKIRCLTAWLRPIRDATQMSMASVF